MEYEQELSDFLRTNGAAPCFDSIFLGLGEDGHTASLFPGTAAPNETHKLVATVYVERLNAYRLTITLPVINAGAHVSFLVAGEDKSAIVKALLGQDSNPAHTRRASRAGRMEGSRGLSRETPAAGSSPLSDRVQIHRS